MTADRKHPYENTKTCPCGKEIMLARFGGGYVSLEREPTHIYVLENQMGKTACKVITGHVDHKFTCPLAQKVQDGS